MNRKGFVESHGAECRNWRWSWSFVNHAKRFVIFGAWDVHTNGNTSLILSKDWNTNPAGRKQPAYAESREHLRLVEEDGYDLFVFPQEYSDERLDEVGHGPSTIKDFTPELLPRTLRRVGREWYASDGAISGMLPEEVTRTSTFPEGASVTVSINAYERSSAARDACLAHHGCRCAVCDLSFEEVYGEIGRGYIHVHHIVPLSEVGEGYEVDPIADLVPVCPNCHAMIHRPTPVLSVERLRAHLSEKRA